MGESSWEKMEDESNLENFVQWACRLGVSDSCSSCCLGHNLSVSHFPEGGGRGLAAARVIKRGEVILRVPKAALMTIDDCLNLSLSLSAALAKSHSLSPAQILSIALLNEVNKGRSSAWHPYLRQLPRSYDLLESFGQFEIEALQIDDAIWTAEKAVHKSKREWEEAKPLLHSLDLKPQLISYNAWLWASATVSSRTMHIPWDTAGCLCPVGDFFNYAPPEDDPHQMDNSDTDRLTDAGYDEAVGSYCFYARRDYEKGDQVLLSYGTYTNLELLEHYGFLLQDNPNDKAFISLEPEMYSLCSWTKESLYIYQDGKPSFALLTTLRLWATPANKRRSVKHIALAGLCISPENESTAVNWIAKKCQALLSSCSTSVDEDTSLLNTIEKMMNCDPAALDYGELSTMVHNEISCFLRSKNIVSGNGKLPSKIAASGKVRRSMYRWKLAVEWRMRYKKILSDCISYCHKISNDVC